MLLRQAAEMSEDSVLQRVIFWHRLPGKSYAALLGASTAVLDTFPYSGFTSILDGLATGVPVVAMGPTGPDSVLRSGSLAPVQGAALLRTCGVGQLVARS